MPPVAAKRLPPNVEGALWMLLSSATFVAMTSLIKYLGSDYPPQVQAFYRQISALLFLAPFILRAPIRTLRTNRIRTLLFRASCGAAGMILMFYSYQRLPMADANALSFTRPLWVTLLAAVVLREVLGMQRMAALLVGFVGMIIILRPGGHHEAYGWPQAAALLSAFLQALSIAGMKSLTRDLSAFSILAWSSILGVVFTLPLALPVWRWPSPADFALLFLMGLMGAINQAVFIKGMSVGDAVAMAPLDYIRLVFSVAAGFWLFAEIPDVWTLVGALVIVASTLYITLRDVRLGRARRAAERKAASLG